MTARGPEPTAAERAALYLAGAMSDDERHVFEEAVVAGDESLIAELRRLEPAADALADGVAVEPDPSTREKLMTRIKGASSDAAPSDVKVWNMWQASDASGTLFTMRSDEGGWEETGVDGVLVRRLFVDQQANRMTAMFRMSPGAEYVPHRHDAPEECYVLEGDLQVGDDVIMRAGDYQRAPAGSHHGVQRTESGCLLLVTCSLDDEWE